MSNCPQKADKFKACEVPKTRSVICLSKELAGKKQEEMKGKIGMGGN